MIRKTTSRRRLAALTTGALMAGGLIVAPAVAGLSTASAAPTTLGYTCTVVGGGQSIPQDSTISIETTAPASVALGRDFTADFAVSIDMGKAAFGPIQSLTGPFDIPITVGGQTTVVKLASSTAPVTGLVFTGNTSGTFKAPATAGAAPMTVGTVVGNLKTTPFDAPTVATCLPDAGQDQTIGSVDVIDDGTDPTPVAVPVTGAVAIKGTPKVGKKLTAVPGKASGAKVSYQWLSNGKAVKNATSSTMKLSKSLKGKKVSVKATYTKAGYTKVTQTSKSVTIKK